MDPSSLCRIVAASLVGLAVQAAVAQAGPPTAGQVGRDPSAIRQEEEQRRAEQLREQQRQSQQEADRHYHDTLRQQQSSAANDMAQGEAVRRTWQQRPPLAPEKNPLLGRWESLGSTGQRKGAAPGPGADMASLADSMIAGLTSSLCDSMLGRGTIEFRPTGPVAIGSDGRERPMYRAEYRGGGSRVVVLPQAATFTHMIIDFDGADRATVATVGCRLARAKGSGTPMANTPHGPFDGSWDTKWGGGRAALDLIQTGSVVTGAYSGTSQGKVTGTIAGKVLTGHWAGSVPGDKGSFVLTFSADGKSFAGTWGTGNSRDNGGPWIGTRK